VQADESARLIAAILTERGQTLAVVEASAGGRLSAALTAIPGSSAWFLGAAIAYSAVAKEALLGIGGSEMASSGAVGASAALLLARAALRRLGATWAVAESGIAGPQGTHRSPKPPGLAYVAVVGPNGQAVREIQTGCGERASNQQAFAASALALLTERLQRE
jgi:nicotinamide-nucleotide amidase